MTPERGALAPEERAWLHGIFREWEQNVGPLELLLKCLLILKPHEDPAT